MANEATSIWTNSAGDHIVYPDGPDNRFTFRKGDFTIDFWGQNTNTGSAAVGWFSYATDSSNRFHLTNYSNLEFYSIIGGSSQNLSFTNTRDLLWHHYAVCRTGSTLSIYIDGVIKGSNSAFTQDMTLTGATFRVGVRSNGSNHSQYSEEVYMEEFRVSHSARYGNIDIPTTQLKTWQTAGRGQNALLPHHTKLLIQSNSTMTTSDAIIDQSGHNTITAVDGANTVTQSIAQTNFGNTAFLFGSGNAYLGYTSDGSDHIGTQDFSYEQWIYPTSLAGWICYFVQRGGGNSSQKGLMIGITGTSSDLGMEYNNHDGGASLYIPVAKPIQVNAWQHTVHARSNGRISAWLNGVLTDTTTAGGTASINNPSGQLCQIGHGDNGFTGDFDGYMDGIRLCIGQAAYTPNFIPYGGQKNVAIGRGGAVTDARHPSANTHAIRMGQAAMGSTLATNANTYCLDFDGTADYLINNTPNWRSADDRGTFFAWIYPDVNNATQIIVAAGDTAGSHTYWGFYMSSNGRLSIQQDENDTGDYVYSVGTVSAAAWHSVALVSSGTAWSIYLDGTVQSLTVEGGGSNTGEWFSDSTAMDNITIGARLQSLLSDEFNGKIMQVAYWGGASGTTGVLDADAIAALHAAGKGYDIKGSGNTGNYDSWADDLKGYWRMGNHYLDTAGNAVIHDASGYGADMAGISVPLAKTWTTGTTFLEGWQDRGFFTGDKYTSLLIQSAHANGSTTFTDSGPGFKKTLFDGASDYAHKTSVSNYRQGDDRGTINAWVKLKDYTSRAWFCATDTSGTNSYYGVYTGSTGLVTINRADTISDRTINAVSLGVWNMITVTEEANQDSKFYVNGELWESHAVTRGSGSPSSPALTGDERWFGDISGLDIVTIGALAYNTGPTRSDYFDGQIAQVGVWSASSGTDAVLTAAQISAIHDLGPGADLTTSYGTGLVDYWTFGNKITEGTDTGSTIYSQVASGNDLTGVSLAAPYAGHTITAVNGAYHSAAHSVVGGSSMFFDGSNDYLNCGSVPDCNFGTADFTIDFWVNYASSSSGNGIANWASSTWQITHGGSNEPYMQNSSGFSNTIGPTCPVGIWRHIAVVRQDGYLSSFIDGVRFREPTAFTTSPSGTGDLTIAKHVGYYLTGYLDEFRISKGLARYTPSIERYANTFVEKGDTGDAFTALQIQSNGAKSGTGFSAGLNRTGYNTGATTIGGTPTWVSTVGDPFGGANTALYFNGTDNYIGIADSTDWYPTGAFTFETWVYWTTAGDYALFFEQATSHNNRLRCAYQSASDRIAIDWYNGTASVDGNVSFNFNGQFSKNEWHHVVLERRGAAQVGINWEAFCDGVSLAINGSANLDDPIHNISAPMCFGGRDWTGTNDQYHDFWHGYMDNIRWSNGIARYGGNSLRTTQQVVTSSNSDTQVVTSNSTFGSGTNIFTTDAYTALLLQGDGTGYSGTAGDTFTDESASPGLGAKTVNNNGGVLLRQGVSAFGANSYFFDGTNADSLSVASSADFSMDGDFTIEMWAKADASISGTETDIMFSRYGGSPDVGYQVNAFANGSCAFYHGDGSEGWSAITNPHSNFKDGSWHHLATQRKGNTFSIWIDGKGTERDKNYGIVGRTTTDVLYIGNNAGGTEAWHGYLDAIRISKGISRYGYTGANIKAGLNAVHHSHCKLLITSNTYSGNTHFDDFSDQGNYWNQTPESYFFDGTDDYIDVGSTALVSDYPFSVSIWFKQDSAVTKHLWGMFDEATASIGYQMRVYSTGEVVVRARNTADGVAQTPAGSAPVGQWHHVLGVFTNDTSRAIHLNGQTQASNTTDVDFNTVVDNTIWGAERDSSPGGYFNGSIASGVMWDVALTQANAETMFQAGPTANFLTNFSANMILYSAMGNHNDLAGRPADTAATVYDRSGNNDDGTTAGTMYTPNKGTLIKPYGTVKHTTDRKNFGSSAIWFDGNSDYLEMQPNAMGPGSTTIDFTFEAWVVFLGGDSNAPACIVTSTQTGNSNEWFIRLDGSDYLAFHADSLTADLATSTAAYDTIVDNQASWHHVVGQRKNTKVEMYLDGLQVAHSGTTGTAFTAGGDRDMVLGRREWAGGNVGQYWWGYMDGIAYYHGIAKYNSVALPGQATITPSYLDDPSGNHFTTSGLAVSDQMLDSPENNFCTLNPLTPADDNPWTSMTAAKVLSEGNLRAGKAGHVAYRSTIGMSSGKWYWEAFYENTNLNLGIISTQPPGGTAYSYNDASAYGVYPWDDQKIVAGVWGGSDSFGGDPTDSGGGNSQNKMVMFAYDADNDKFWMGIDGSWNKQEERGAGRDPSKGRNPDYEPSVTYKPYVSWFHPASTTQENNVTYNFGQGDKDGENNFTDSNRRGGFRFEPPSGFLSLCTANMSDADYALIGPNSAAGTPDQHFDTVLWAGNSKDNTRIGGLNFQPDLVWMKGRDFAPYHIAVDSLRGPNKMLWPSEDLNEYTVAADGSNAATFIQQLNSDGFSVGTNSYVNNTGNEYVAWCWKAGNGTVENGDGTIASTVSVNQDAGFSIVHYNGSGAAATVGHGLSKIPDLVITKNREADSTPWVTWHKDMYNAFASSAAYMYLDNTGGDETTTVFYDGTKISSSVVGYLGGNANVNGSGVNYITYAWHGVEGFSKFGKYTGNGSTDGPFIYTGFKPALVIVKIITAAERWYIWDNKRDRHNPVYKYLMADTASAEGASYTGGLLDFVSNGFKLRNATGTYWNHSSHTYIYMAWAETPFKYATAR